MWMLIRSIDRRKPRLGLVSLLGYNPPGLDMGFLASFTHYLKLTRYIVL